ncbi:hypothetical protein G7077_11415 [Sphingomonas piscis]|uniref:Uncharacterized protein n=1 Tax=Sphingomonas piscis TaxID=2714943 RepID=A0A6G7YRQ2_9SPHN|nr:hypothetical protein [Sphingomonas piscis]QIK79420.1 hypothetical protein G7077_11415 [Sphingomonas piscis]
MRLDRRFAEGAHELEAPKKSFKNLAVERDEKLERLCGERADRFVGKRAVSIAQLVLLTRIWCRLLFTPLIRLRLEDDAEAKPIRRWLDKRTFRLRSPLHQAASVLRIDRRSDPLAGSRFATLRRMDRKAAKLGITCAPFLNMSA